MEEPVQYRPPFVPPYEFLESLKVLVCHKIELFNPAILSSFVSGQFGQLTELHCNTTKFHHNNQVPSPGQLQVLRRFYAILQTAVPDRNEADVNIRNEDDAGPAAKNTVSHRIRAGLAIFFNSVKLDLRKRFDEYQFHQLLWSMHLHNIKTNRLTVIPSRTVLCCDFIDMLLFCLGIRDKEFFRPFVQCYPNVQVVTVFVGPRLQFKIGSGAFSMFFAACRGLLCLAFRETRLKTGFYEQLSRMNCCRSLTHLTIDEKTALDSELDFAFLANFPSLIAFETNVMSKERMVDCLAIPSRVIQFTFCFDKADQRWHNLVFQRVEPPFYRMYIQFAPEDRPEDRPEDGFE